MAPALLPFGFLTGLLQSRPPPPDAQLVGVAVTLLVGLLLMRLFMGPILYFLARRSPSGREVWWGLFATLVPIIGSIVFLVTRRPAKPPVTGSWNPWVVCPWCGAPRGYSPLPCPRCGQALPPPGPPWPPALPPAPAVPSAPGAPPQLSTPPAPGAAFGPVTTALPPPPSYLAPAPEHAASRPRTLDITGWQALGAVLFTFALALIAMQLLFLPILFDPSTTQQFKESIATAPWFILASLVVQDSILMAVAFDQAVFRGRLTWPEMGFKLSRATMPLARQVGLGLGAGVLTFLASSLALQILIDALKALGISVAIATPNAQPQISSLSDYGYWVVSGVIIAPFAEEIFFRGYALSGFIKRGATNRGLVATSVLFAAVHLEPLSFGPLLLAGLVLGSLYVRTGSLVAPITAHATNNFIVVTLTLLGI